MESEEKHEQGEKPETRRIYMRVRPRHSSRALNTCRGV
jgi:hypothetical protein